MTEFVKITNPELPIVSKIGAIQYVGYIEAPESVTRRYGVKMFQLFPNGATKKALAGSHCISSIGDTPQEAWQKATQNTALMAEYGIEL